MAITFARPVREESDQLSKDALVGALIAIKLTEYDPALPSSYGQTTAAFVELTVVDGDHAGKTEEKWAAFGNLGKQIGEALDEGDIAVGRITSGTSANGRSWYGIDFAEEPEDFAAAEKALLAGTSRPSAAKDEAPF